MGWLKDGDSKARAKLVVHELLEWIAEGNTPLYPAVRACIIQICPFKQEDSGRSKHLQKETLLIIASAVTVALRPLQQFPAQEDAKGVNERQVAASKKASEGFCSHVLTIPFVLQRLPAAMIPALQHPSVLTPCLQTFGTSKSLLTTEQCTPCFKSVCQLEANLIDSSPSSSALINIVALAKGPTKNGFTDFVKGIAFDAYLKAVCSLLDQSIPWIQSLHSNTEAKERDERHDFVLCNTGLSDFDNQGKSFCHADARLQLIEDLGPLYQHWHLRQLLEHNCENYELGSETAMVVLKLSDIAMLYSRLLTIFKLLHEERIPCPVLNLLAFAPGFLGQLWAWLDDVLGLTHCYGEKASLKAGEVTDAGKQSEKGMLPRKDERLSGSLSSRWASAVSKIKGKGSSSDAYDSDVRVIEAGSATNFWDVEKLKNGPPDVTKEVLHVLTLFCAAYSHLLMILDDDEFYKRQVPFTLKQQRVIALSLNTMVYNGFFSASKQHFMPLLEVAIKCLNALYGRDCRRSFCPLALWLAPAVGSRPPIPAAARAHEVALASIKVGEYSQAPAIGYVLILIPHVIPFEERVQIFREFVKADKAARKMAGEFVGPGPGSIEIAIRRDHLVEDAFAQLNTLGSKLKSGLNVSFVNEHGLSEAGLDYGGLFKEFLTDLAKAAFDPGYGLFAQREAEEGFLFPHPAAGNLQHGLRMIEFLGRIVGKAMYEGILLDYCFSHVFIWKLLGRYVFFDELSTLDPELHQSLMYLKRYEGDIMDLALDFTVTEEFFGKRKVVELRPGGANIQVTNENKLQYVYAMADYKLNKQMQPLINAFSRGLSDIIAPAWLSLFSAKELNQLLAGGEHDFDIDDLRIHTNYTGGFTENSRTVKQFWEVLKEFEPQERCALLKFVTSCSRAPLLGFKHLQPAFTIHKVSCDTTLWAMLGGQDVNRLPSASTCYNTLKLPTYKRMSTLKMKLSVAIHSNAGFELS